MAKDQNMRSEKLIRQGGIASMAFITQGMEMVAR